MAAECLLAAAPACPSSSPSSSSTSYCSWTSPLASSDCQLFQRSISFVLTSQRLKSQMTYGKKIKKKMARKSAKKNDKSRSQVKWAKCQSRTMPKQLQTCHQLRILQPESGCLLDSMRLRRVSWANKIMLQPVNANWAAWRWAWANAFPHFRYPRKKIPEKKLLPNCKAHTPRTL